MHVLFVEGLQLCGHIGVAGIEDGVAFAAFLPPVPILHDRIHGNVPGTVSGRDGENFRLRLVTILGLKEAVSPLRKQRRMAGHGAVLMEDGIHLRTVEDVVVNLRRGHRLQVQLQRKAVVDVAEGSGVPKNGVAFARNQQRDGDVGIVLAELDDAAAIVEHAVLVLAEPVQRFRGIGAEAVLDVVETRCLRRQVGAREIASFPHQRFALSILEGQVAVAFGQCDDEAGRGEGRDAVRLAELERRAGAGVGLGQQPWLRFGGSRGVRGP